MRAFALPGPNHGSFQSPAIEQSIQGDLPMGLMDDICAPADRNAAKVEECRAVPVISLWQPWASALFALRPDGRPLKPDETRHWKLPAKFIGVEVAIHAAKRDTLNERDFWKEDVLASPYRELYGQAFEPLGISKYSDLPRGCLVGVVVFGPSVETDGQFSVEEIAAEWGNYSVGRFAWPTLKRTLFAHPIPCMGRQGFFTAALPIQPET